MSSRITPLDRGREEKFHEDEFPGDDLEEASPCSQELLSPQEEIEIASVYASLVLMMAVNSKVNFLDTIKGCFLVLVALFFQVLLPTSLIYNWTQVQGSNSFVLMYGEPTSSPEVTLKISKAVVGTYVMIYILLKDIRDYSMVEMVIRGHQKAFQTPLILTFAQYLILRLASAASMILFIVTTFLICHQTSSGDVITSGVGTLFVLDVDYVLSMGISGILKINRNLRNGDFWISRDQLFKFLLSVRRTSSLTSSQLPKLEQSSCQFNLFWRLVHWFMDWYPSIVICGFWSYFIYRVHYSEKSF